MDIQSAVIGVSVFIVSGSILLFIYIFGMKEKSYEEAITEQRQQAKALLGSHTRPKPKEKKAKKLNKKVRNGSIAYLIYVNFMWDLLGEGEESGRGF